MDRSRRTPEITLLPWRQLFSDCACRFTAFVIDVCACCLSSMQVFVATTLNSQVHPTTTCLVLSECTVEAGGQ